MQLFETMRLENGDIPRLDYHFKRIQKSSADLKFNLNTQKWHELIQLIRETYPKGEYRLKVTLERDGHLDYIVAPLPEKTLFTARLVQRTHHVNQKYLVNKTSERHYLEHNHETDLILLYDETGKILEFDIGNIMIGEGNDLYTPTYHQDFLLGCMRQSLLDQGRMIEKDIYVDDLKKKLQANQINLYLINSLREVADVKIYI